MSKYIVAMVLLLGISGFANATGPGCDHPNFYVKECDYPELNGTPGADGEDGEDGEQGPAGPTGPQGPVGPQGPQGEPGKDGADGKDGRDGINGRDGVVPSSWYGEMLEFTVASRAAHAYLPQDKDDRLTFGLARAGGRTGAGVGYARILDREDNLAFTISVGRSADSVVGNATIGWEF